MNQADRLDYILERIDHGVAFTRALADRNKRRSLAITIAVIALGASTTILLGLNISDWGVVCARIALVLSTLVTGLTAIEKTLGFREVYINMRLITARFMALKAEIEFYRLAADSEAPEHARRVQEYFDQMQAIWHDCNENWQKVRTAGATEE